MTLLPFLRRIQRRTTQGRQNMKAKYEKSQKIILCASGAETPFSVTAESNGMLCIPLQRNIM